MALGNDKIWLDPFAFRQFDDAQYSGTKINIPKETFMEHVIKYYNERLASEVEFPDRPVLVDGYAPFCKHIFMPNFSKDILQGELSITKVNEHLLKSSFEARKDDELPVLTRYFPIDKVSVPKAAYLDLIRKCA